MRFTREPFDLLLAARGHARGGEGYQVRANNAMQYSAPLTSDLDHSPELTHGNTSFTSVTLRCSLDTAVQIVTHAPAVITCLAGHHADDILVRTPFSQSSLTSARARVRLRDGRLTFGTQDRRQVQAHVG